MSMENRCFFLPIDWGGLLEAGYLCKLLSGEIFKAFLSIVHLPKLFFKDTSVESVAPFFRICWNILECFRIRRGSWYQHSVEACLTIRLCWPKDFDRLKFPTFLPPFQTRRNGRKKSEMDIFMKMPRHLVIELDSAQF